MAANQAPDHWAKLIAEMGIQSPPDQTSSTSEPPEEVKEVADEILADELDETETAPVAELPPPPPAVAKAVERPRRISDWDRLAEELGVPVSPRPSKPTPPAAKQVETVKTSLPCDVKPREVDQVEESDQVESESDSSAAAKEWEEEMVELTDPLFLDSAVSNPKSEDDGETSAENVEQSEESSEPKVKSGRRRRRRRRGRRLPESEPTETEVQEAELEAASDTVELIDNEPEATSSEVLEGETSSAAEGSESTERRRRRRRRRPRRKSEATPSDSSPTVDDDEESPRLTENAESEGGEEEWGAADEDRDETEDSDEDEQSSKLSHRGIPTWEEAIQLVITNNVESRSKNPNSGSAPRGRSHRKPRERPSS